MTKAKRFRLKNRWKLQGSDVKAFFRKRRPSVAFADFDIVDPKSSFSATCLLLYGFTHVLTGLVLTLADALSSNYESNSVDHKYYLEIFLLIEYSLSIVGILVLQGMVCLYERDIKKRLKHQEEEKYEPPDSKLTNDSHEERDKAPRKWIFRKRSDRSLQPETVNMRMLNEDAAAEDSSPTSSPVLLAAQSPPVMAISFNELWKSSGESKPPNDDDGDDDNHDHDVEALKKTSDQPSSLNTAEILSPIQPRSSRNRSSCLKQTPKLKSHDTCEKPRANARNPGHERIYRDKEGVNLYLRLGAVGFGFGVMIHDGFKISDHLEGLTMACRSHLWVPKYVTHLAYIFIQTFFIFKFHRIVYDWKRSIVRFIIIHLATTNFCQWIKTIVFEISEEIRRGNLTGHATASHGENASAAVGGPHCVGGLAESMSPFLFPCAIEYSLIAGAVCYKIFQKVGGSNAYLMPFPEFMPPEDSSQDNGKSEDSLAERRLYREEKMYSECHKSHRGLFIGLLLVMATMVALGLFFYLHRHNDEKLKLTAITIYQLTEIVLQTVSGMACVAAFFKMRVLKFRSLTEIEAFDDNLLLIGMSGMIVYNLFLILPSLLHWHEEMTAKLYAVKALLEMVQTLLQVFFIIEASRRCAYNYRQVKEKPGRTWVTFLLVANLAMWIVNTFEVKRADQHHYMHRQFYSGLSWSVVTFVCFPLIIFFRFHSTVCLSDIWLKCYKIHR